MKILTFCQYYYPENFQITPICEQLVSDGHDVTVVTGLPNYPTGVIPEEYKKGHRDEVINGVRVIRCHEIGSACFKNSHLMFKNPLKKQKNNTLLCGIKCR